MSDESECSSGGAARRHRREPIAAVSTDVTAFVGRTRSGPTDTPRLVRSMREFSDLYGGPWVESPLGASVWHYFLNGGRQALICAIDTAGDPLAARHVSDPSLQSDSRGLWMLERCPDVNIICIPPFQTGVDVDRATWDAAIDLAWRRRAFVLVDPAQSWTSVRDVSPAAVDALVSPHEAAANAAIYFPRIRCVDPVNVGSVQAFAPAGAIAGIYARTDARRGVWKAPAGLEARLDGVQVLSLALSDAEQGDLNRRGINTLRTFPGGHVVWGARTLRGHDQLGSDWKYVPARRLALFVEESLTRGLRWAATERGGPALWEAMTRDVEAWLLSLFRLGAFQGSTPREACFVRCDASTTTEEDVARGVTTLVVGIAPLTPSEFVLLKVPIPTAPMS